MKCGSFFGSLSLAGLLLAVACASRAPASTVESSAPKRRHENLRSLEEHLPPTELSWLVELHPAQLARTPDARKIADQLLEPKRIEAFSRLVGASPEEVPQLLIANYGIGTMYLADTDSASNRIAKHLCARSLHCQESKRPSGIGVTETASEGAFTSMLTLDAARFVWVDGDPSLSKLALAFAEGRSRKIPSLAERTPWKELLSEESAAPIRLFVAGPFEKSQVTALRTSDAMRFSFLFTEGRFRVEATLLGVYENEVALTLENELLELIESPLGRSLGARALASEPHTNCSLAGASGERDRCQVDLEFSLENWLKEVAWINAESLGDLTRRFDQPLHREN